MKIRFLLLMVLMARSVSAEAIQDPIKDFLNLPIPGRYSDASEVVNLEEVFCDIDNDGVDDIFIGHHQMWNGGNGIYFTAYKRLDGGYQRLLPSNKDVVIDFYGGSRRCVFVGWISEVDSQGILIANPVYERVPGDPSKLLPVEQYSSRKVYRIQNGSLLIDELGPLDVRTPEGKAFSNRYFGEGVKSRPIVIDNYSAKKLEEWGYKLPDWKEPLESTPIQEEPQKARPSTPRPFSSVMPLPSSKSEPSPIKADNPVVKEESPSSLAWLYALAVILLGGGGFIVYCSRHR